MKNCAILKNKFFAIEKNTSLLKHLWYKKKIFAILSMLQHEKLYSIEKQTLRYCKKCLVIEQILCCSKKSLYYWKTVFAIEIPLTSKKSSLYCQYCNQIGGLPSFWNLFLPTFSVSNIVGTLFDFNGICFPLDIQKHDSSKCSEHKTEVSVGRQSVLLSFSIQTSKSFESWVVHWKSTNKMMNFKIFNISVIFSQSLVKTVFGVRCPLSTAKYAARNWIS